MTMKRYRRRRRRLNPRFVILCCALACLLAGAAWGIWTLTRPLPGEGVELPGYVEQRLLTVNPYSRPGTPLKKIRGVVIHYVGNPNTTAEANRNYFESLSSGQEETWASAHFIVGLGGEVLQCIPLTEISHASNQRNGDTVAIEVCHLTSDGIFSDVTYDRVVELTAWLCRTFELDPAEDVIRHFDVTGKICPRYYVENPEAWEALRQDVAAALENSGG